MGEESGEINVATQNENFLNAAMKMMTNSSRSHLLSFELDVFDFHLSLCVSQSEEKYSRCGLFADISVKEDFKEGGFLG
jgi:hypothetical protein